MLLPRSEIGVLKRALIASFGTKWDLYNVSGNPRAELAHRHPDKVRAHLLGDEFDALDLLALECLADQEVVFGVGQLDLEDAGRAFDLRVVERVDQRLLARGAGQRRRLVDRFYLLFGKQLPVVAAGVRRGVERLDGGLAARPR